MNSYFGNTVPPLTTVPPEGFGAAFDYNYLRWYFFPLEYKGDNIDYSWVLSEKELEAVGRISGLRSVEEWGYADSPFQNGLGTGAFTEFIVWMIEMNIMNDNTADLIGRNAFVNQTRTLMNFYKPQENGRWDYTPWKSWEEETCPPTPKKTFPNERVKHDSVKKNLEEEFNEQDYLKNVQEQWLPEQGQEQWLPEQGQEKCNNEGELSAILNYENVSDTSSSEE